MVCTSGAVERNSSASDLTFFLDLLLGPSCRQESTARDCQGRAIPPRRAEPLVDLAQNGGAYVERCTEPVETKTVAHLARQSAEVRVDGRDVNGNARMFNRPGIEVRGHEV